MNFFATGTVRFSSWAFFPTPFKKRREIAPGCLHCGQSRFPPGDRGRKNLCSKPCCDDQSWHRSLREIIEIPVADAGCASANGKRCPRFKVTSVRNSRSSTVVRRRKRLGEILLNETRFLDGIPRREGKREGGETPFHQEFSHSKQKLSLDYVKWYEKNFPLFNYGCIIVPIAWHLWFYNY